MNQIKKDAAIFKALGDETRLLLFSLISQQPNICACELLEKVPVSQTTLSHHLKILAQENLVTVTKNGRWRHYSSNQETIKQLFNNIKNFNEEE